MDVRQIFKNIKSIGTCCLSSFRCKVESKNGQSAQGEIRIAIENKSKGPAASGIKPSTTTILKTLTLHIL